jgi:tRNA(Ile)-lysidine synthase TilS/MesJ
MILAQLSKEIQYLYPEGTIMIIIRPLYGIAKAEIH